MQGDQTAVLEARIDVFAKAVSGVTAQNVSLMYSFGARASFVVFASSITGVKHNASAFVCECVYA
jgi:hypothetical protein